LPQLIRSACLTGYVEVAQSFGLDPARMLRSAGLTAASLVDPDIKIPIESVRALLEASASAAGAEDFGLRMAEKRRLSNLGPIGLVVRNEPTVRKALETLGRYLRLHNEALFSRVEEAQGVAILRQEMIVGERARVRQAMELAVGVLYGILRELLGPSWEPRRVCFSHPAPKSLVNHLRVFGRFVAFGCEFNGIVVASRDLDARTPLADPVMLKYAQQYVDSMFARPNLDMSDKVRELVCTLLPLHRCTADQVAQSLGVDRRTVHRHLGRRGETFSDVVDAVRAELATRYLESGDRALSEVAELLGFSAQSAFARWFRNGFGCTVTEWRASRVAQSRTTAAPSR
jgi:AraC-like DNA-binding protein